MNHLLAFVPVAEQNTAASPLPLQLKYNTGMDQAFRGCVCGLSFEISEVSCSFRGPGLHAVILQKLSSNPEVLLPTRAAEPLVPFTFMKPLPFKLSRREI